jgi:hypothetical protein
MKSNFLRMLVLLAVMLAFATPVMAAGLTQVGEPPAPIGLVDVAFVLAVVAFFKMQFNLTGPYPIVAAAVVAILIGLGPRIEVLLPFLQGWFADIVGIIKLVLFAAGAYDFLTDMGPKFMGVTRST